MKRNDYLAIIRDHLPGIIEELEAQGMHQPPLRSCYYLLLDRGLLLGGVKDYDALDRRLSAMRDAGEFPYGLLAGDSGTDRRGMTPRELSEYLRRMEKENVPPELCDGRLKAILVEKAGLVPYLESAVDFRVPVGSAGGQLRKEWAVSWVEDLQDLAEELDGGEPHIVYLGDHDRWGSVIKRTAVEWLGARAVPVDVLAVTEAQLDALNRDRGLDLEKLHIDGYIALVGPQEFARMIRGHLGLQIEEARP